MPDRDSSTNEFEADKAGTNARTAAEAAIEELRQRGGVFVNAVRATRMPMVLTDPNLPGNPIVFANSSFLKLSGYSMEEVLGQQPHFMNGPGTDPHDAARFAEVLRADQDDIIETIQYRKNGSRFFATVLLSAYKDEDGRTLNHFMSWLDVTRRVEAETELAALQKTQAALRESEQRYRLLFNSIDEGFCVIEVLFDEAGNPVDYVFVETNPAFERQTGLVDAVGKRMRQLAPDHEEHWFGRYGRIVTNGQPERFEDVAAALGRWYDVFAFRIGEADQHRVAVLFRDMLARKRAEQALRQSEEQQVFLLKLTDALRSISDAREIQATTARMVCEHLGADRAMYSEVEGEYGSERGTIRGQYVGRGEEKEATTPFPEHFTFGQFGQHTMAARYRGEPLIVADVQADPGYSADERAAWAQFGVRAAVVATLPKDGRLVAEFGVHSTTAREWTEGEIALIQECAERTWAAAERALAETALRESEERLQAAFRSVPVGVGVIDTDGKVLTANDEFRRFLPSGVVPSRDPERVSRWRAWDQDGQPIDPQDWPSARALRGETVVPGLDMLFMTDDGREIWTEVATAPTRDRAGAVTGAVSTVTDVDAAKRAQEALLASERHANTLLAELQHRVRNTLAVVRSILRRTAERSDSIDDLLAHFEGRLNAFSRVQATVTRAAGRGAELRDMIEDELLAVATREGDRLRIKGPEVCLKSRPAESISLAIHELATNAVKHGTLGEPGGRVAIDWKRHGKGDAEVLEFRWRESGLADPPKEGKEGFGMDLLLKMLPYDLGAETGVDFGGDGLTFTMRLPLADKLADK